jgi:hypothetical protein
MEKEGLEDIQNDGLAKENFNGTEHAIGPNP